MKIFMFLKDKKRLLIIVGILTVILIACLLLVPIVLKKPISKPNEIIVQPGEYTGLFNNSKTVLLYEYVDISTNHYTYKDATDIINKINTLFDIDIKLVKKGEITEEEYNKVDNSLSYDDWKDTGELTTIKDGKIDERQELSDYATIEEIEAKLCEMLADTSFISKEKLTDMLDAISVDDYLTKAKNNNKFYLLLGNNVDSAIYTIYVFSDLNLDFHYLDYSKLGDADMQKLINSNDKFSAMLDDDVTLTYIFDANTIKSNSYSGSTYSIRGFIDEVDEFIISRGNMSVIEYGIKELANSYIYLPDNSILNFATYTDDALKTKMILDKMDNIDQITNDDELGGTSVSKDLFDSKAKELFGDNVIINVSAIGEIQAGSSCAYWTYDSAKKVFERGETGCGGDSGTYKKVVTSNFIETANSYTLETKEAYIKGFEGEVYSDSKYKNLVGTLDEDTTEEAEDAYLKSITNKLYTYKYTFIKNSSTYYLGSYEIIK